MTVLRRTDARPRRQAARRTRWRLLGGRLVLALPTLFGVSVLVFVLGRLTLASPDISALGVFAPEEAKAQFNEQFHLQEPLVGQYFLWAADVFTGDLGESFVTKIPVRETMVSAVGVTALLTVGAAVFAALIGFVAGTLGGLYRHTWIGRFVWIWSMAAVSVPQFWLGLVLILVFSVELGWLPTGGYVAPGTDPVAFAQFMLLPWLALALAPAGLVARVTQVRVQEEVQMPHVLTARGLGIGRSQIVRHYVLRNALIEPTTVIGVQIGYMLGGAFVLEQVFSLPGIGLAAINAARQGDYPLVQAAALIAAVGFLLVNLIVDLVHLSLDVRADEP